MEKCQRCGEEGQDRRTLWMACFYEMGELNIPFDQLQLISKPRRCVGNETLPETKIIVPIFEDIPDSKENKYSFFTLRVCKDCRADWMRAISFWFHESVEKSDDGIEEGTIYVRELGTNVKRRPEDLKNINEF